MNKALVVTNKFDIHADYVINQFNEAGLSEYVVRLNTEDFISNTVVMYDPSRFHVVVLDSQREFNTSEISCVWFRRPEDPTLPDDLETGAQQYISEQALSILDGIYYATEEAFWINPRNTMRMSNSKLHQLQVARQVGLKTPRTLLTNSIKEARCFFDTVSNICIKSLYGPQITYQGEAYSFFTIKLQQKEKLDHLHLIETCPSLFQEFIEKQYDLRVIAIGDTLHAFEIHSQEDDRTKEDFRVISPDRIRHQVHNLDPIICKKIKAFMQRYQVVFSAFDFAVTQEGEYYFLENNPNGQWLWLEMLTDIPISRSLFDLMRHHL